MCTGAGHVPFNIPYRYPPLPPCPCLQHARPRAAPVRVVPRSAPLKPTFTLQHDRRQEPNPLLVAMHHDLYSACVPPCCFLPTQSHTAASLQCATSRCCTRGTWPCSLQAHRCTTPSLAHRPTTVAQPLSPHGCMQHRSPTIGQRASTTDEAPCTLGANTACTGCRAAKKVKGSS